MPYLLPTICSRNRQMLQVNRPRRRVVPRHDPPPPAGICNHRVTIFGGRCPVCYRQSIRNYGRSVRVRPAPRPILPQLVLPHRNMPVFRPPVRSAFPPRPTIPPLPRPPRVVPRLPIVPRISSNYLVSMGLTLPGRCIVAQKSEDICPICQDDYTKDRNCQITPCGHEFHSWCFHKWFVRKNTCPMCRKTFH